MKVGRPRTDCIVLLLELDKEAEERWIYFNYYPNSLINKVND